MSVPAYDILKDDLSGFERQGPAFVTFGEVMVRDTPADLERPERTRLVHLSMAGSEYSLAIGLARLGIPAAYITRVPDNPYGQAVRNIARENGVNTDCFVWAPKTEPIGRMIYEIGRTPRRSVTVYQRQYSAASRLDAGMVNWKEVLKNARLFHTSGITFGLAAHSHYDRNYCQEAFKEAIAEKPEGCLVGMDFNYRSALWTVEQARDVLTPIVTDHVDVLITTLGNMAELYGIGCGRYSARQIVAGEIGPWRTTTFAGSRSRFTNSSRPKSSRLRYAMRTHRSSTGGNRRRFTRTARSFVPLRSSPSLFGTGWAAATSGPRVSTMGCSRRISAAEASPKECS